MRRRLLGILLFLALNHLVDWGPFNTLVTFGQGTTVTATVVDSAGTPYANGTVSVSLVNTTVLPATLGGNTAFQQTFQTGLNASGFFSLQLHDVTVMTCGGGTCNPSLQWKFFICANPQQVLAVYPPVTTPCFNYTSTGTQISGTSVDISTSLTAVATLIPKVATTTSANTWTATQNFSQAFNAPNISYKTPFDYGAKGNLTTLGPAATDSTSRAGTFVQANCSISSGSAVLTCTGAQFLLTDPNKAIVVNAAGATSPSPCSASFPCALVTTIASFQSSTQVTLSATATTTVSSNALVYYGTDDQAAISSCILNGTLKGGRCTMGNGSAFMVSNSASTINFFSLSQTPIPNGFLDGNGTVLFAPQGVLTGGTNDRFLYIQSNNAGPFQLAGQAKYTLANSPSGATMSGNTITFTINAGNFGSDVTSGRCLAVSGVGVNGYNGMFTVASGGSGTANFTATAPNGITGLAASGGGSVSISLCPGDTSFTLQNAGDSTNFSVGQWVVLREHDSGAGDVIYADWAQVLSVSSPTINLVNPLRMQFPNSRAWLTSTGSCSAANPCGLGAIAVSSSGLMSGYILKDFNLLIPKVFNTNKAAGIAITLARGVQITDHTCVDASQNCIFNYLTQGAIIKGNHFITAVANEQASDVDFSVVANHINETGSSLSGATLTPQGACWDLDFGSAFGTFSNNTTGPCLNEGIAAFAGPYYSSIGGNTFGRLIGNPGGTMIQIAGGIGNTVYGNVAQGGSATTTGISVADSSGFSIVANSDANQIYGNFLKGFPGGNYACSGAWNTDTCSDSTSAAAQGVQIGGSVAGSAAQLQFVYSSATRNAMAFQDVASSSNRHRYTFGPGASAVNAFGINDLNSSKALFNCYENFSNFCNFPQGFGATEGAAPTLIGSGFDQCYGDSTAHAIKCAFNGATAQQLDLISNTSTTTTQILHASATAGVGTYSAIATADIATALTTPGPIGGTTPGTGAFTTLSATGNLTPSQTNGIVGTTTNNNANAGSVGEFVTATLATGSSVSLTTATTANVTSISLTAGDWDVWGTVDYTAGATTSITNQRQGISTTSATLGAQDTFSSDSTAAQVPTASIDDAFPTPLVRLSLSGTTTVFLVSNATFTVSTLKAYGSLSARRVR